MANAVSYGDISPRTAAYVVKQLLERAAPVLLIKSSVKPIRSRRTPPSLPSGVVTSCLARPVPPALALARSTSRWR